MALEAWILASRTMRVVAEDLDILVATDHDVTTDYGPIAKELGLDTLLCYPWDRDFTAIRSSMLISARKRQDLIGRRWVSTTQMKVYRSPRSCGFG